MSDNNTLKSKPFLSVLFRLRFKYIIAFLSALAILIFSVLYLIFWHYNHSISAPLPIESNLQTMPTGASNTDKNISSQTLYVVAPVSLKPALTLIAERFQRHYPHIFLHIDYVDSTDLKAETLAQSSTKNNPIDILLLPKTLPQSVNKSTTEHPQHKTETNERNFDFARQDRTVFESQLLNDKDANALFSQFLLTSNSQDDFSHNGLQSIGTH